MSTRASRRPGRSSDAGHIDLGQLMGRNLLGRQGETLGTIEQVFVDDQTRAPEFATVRTGLFGSRQSFVPLAEAQIFGVAVSVPYDKETVKGAPNIDTDQHLSEQEEEQLYAYYGLAYSQGVSESGLATESSPGGRYARAGSIPSTDEAMTRSEQQVWVGTERVETGRARLRRYVVTEQVQQTVPVTREEVRVEREPITDDNIDAAMRGPEITEGEHEVVLTEERPVVQKETVPVERVRPSKDQVIDEAQVSEEVAKEQIETEGAADAADQTRRRRH